MNVGFLTRAAIGIVLSLHLVANVPIHADETATPGHLLEGLASWYGGKFQGRLTANGEVFDTNELTAAHRTLPFGTIVRVENLATQRSVVVRINDRGPFVDDRVIDLSRAAADAIGLTSAGVAPVRLVIVSYEVESDLRTVQIASFAVRTNAIALATRLGEHGIEATIETSEENAVYRVIVRSVPESDIPELRGRLAALGYPAPLVRQE